MVTFAKVTNTDAMWTGSTTVEVAAELLTHGGSAEEKAAYGEKLRKGAEQYIPLIGAAHIVDVKFGVVQTEGKLTRADLDRYDSVVHRRAYYGVRAHEGCPGLISNPCVKLFYFVKNGQIVADIIDGLYRSTLGASASS